MGKRSKSKGKKSARQERAMHLKNVEAWTKTMSTLDNKYDSSLGGLPTNGRKRERIWILEEQIQLTLNVEESLDFVNRHQFFENELSGVCTCLLLEQLLSADYIQASNSYNEMMKYPLTEDFRSQIKPFSNLLLLWSDEENVERLKEIIHIANQDAFDIIRIPGETDLFWLAYIEKTLIGLSRVQCFIIVEFLSLEMLRNANDKRELKKEWMTIAQTSLVFSYLDCIRLSKGTFRSQFLLEKV
ncbi:predicted protein [Chaetoceros tenuissimus]|uniref:Uncharacterized protein n=1 Tax=Chaetoceros tenuissimus TaxID=426638 RepID=A0AAD3H9E2_9STRA|nr:predicted protein [Chaetoceros tenuissimus]